MKNNLNIVAGDMNKINRTLNIETAFTRLVMCCCYFRSLVIIIPESGCGETRFR